MHRRDIILMNGYRRSTRRCHNQIAIVKSVGDFETDKYKIAYGNGSLAHGGSLRLSAPREPVATFFCSKQEYCNGREV